MNCWGWPPEVIPYISVAVTEAIDAPVATALMSLMLECVLLREAVWFAPFQAPREPFVCPYLLQRRKGFPTSQWEQVGMAVVESYS